jgi:preprotein translocase subunit SecG
MTKLKLSIIFLLLILLIAITNTIAHEQAHTQINLYNDCEYSKYGFELRTMSTYTIGVNCMLNENRQILNSYNEIIGYNFTSLIITILLCTGLIGYVLIDNKEQFK